MRVSFANNAANNTINNKYRAKNPTAENSATKSHIAQSPAFGKGGQKFFNKLYDSIGLTELIARGTAKLAQTNISDKVVEATQGWKSPSARWCDLENAAITFFYMYNTYNNKDIDEDRKLPSMLQNAAVSIAATGASAGVDSLFDPLVDKTGYEFQNLPKEAVQKLFNNSKHDNIKSVKDYHKAVGKLKSNTVFTAVVRFIIPVIMVPAVGFLVAKLKEYRDKQTGADQPSKAQNIQAPPPNFQMRQANPINPVNTLQGKSLTPKTSNENKFKAMYA